MKRLVSMALAAICLAGMAVADPLEGNWRTIPDDNGNSGLIRIAPCGAALCGTLVAAFDGSGNQIDSDDLGRQIITETVAQGGGSYRGKIFSPDRGRTYNSKLQLQGNQLAVSGCAFGICRNGGTWQRQN